MRMLRPALAFATLLLTSVTVTRAADLFPVDRPIAEAVDHFLDETLRKEAVEPAPTADDATLVRRLTLDLVGRIPTAAEARAYVESTDPEKKTRLVDRLMASPGFVRHQATELDTMLMAGNKGSLREYLTRAVGENRRLGQDLPRADAPRRDRQGRRRPLPNTSAGASRISTGSPPRSAPRSSASTSVVPSATTTRWSTTGSRTTSTA